jgi:hypothetical protein
MLTLNQVQSLLTLPANDPMHTVFEVPTFASAFADLKIAVCAFIGTATALFSDLFTCGNVGSTIGCGTGASCVHGLGCNLANIPEALGDIAIEILTTVRTLVDGSPNPQSDLLGDQCSADNVRP